MWRVGQLIREHQEELAQLETLDQGKPLTYADFEVLAAAGTWEYYAGWCTKLKESAEISMFPGMEFATGILKRRAIVPDSH